MSDVDTTQPDTLTAELLRFAKTAGAVGNGDALDNPERMRSAVSALIERVSRLNSKTPKQREARVAAGARLSGLWDSFGRDDGDEQRRCFAAASVAAQALADALAN